MSNSLGSVYPRPDFERASLHWKCLNGPWDFLFDDNDVGLQSGWYHSTLPSSVTVENISDIKATPISESETITAKIAANTQNLIRGNLSLRHQNAATYEKRKINVPFVFQCEASGIGERDVHEVMWYERQIEDIRTDEEKSNGSRLLVRFGAVDYESKVWVNGEYVGGHRGGHVPFDIDITAAIETHNTPSHRLTLRVYDSAYDLTQPRGKQYWGAKPESIFYTPSGGIWQNVWMESVPPTRLADSSYGTIMQSNDIESGTLHSTIAVLGRRAGHKYSMEIQAAYNDIVVGTSEKKDLPRHTDYVNLDLDLRLSDSELRKLALTDNNRAWRNGLALWSPEYPQLYTITIRLFGSTGSTIDQVKTSIGMRSLDWTSRDGMFKLNGHPIFQVLNLDQGYWPKTFMTPPSSDALRTDIENAKAMGFNGCRKHQKVEDPLFLYYADRMGYLVWGEMANAYSFSNAYVERFNQEWMEAVKRDINHPCIVTWTPVNESWAYPDLKTNVEQRNHIRSLYYLTKTLDPTRPINDNCGWEHIQSDLTTFHDYADSPTLTETCKSLAGILSPKARRTVFLEPIPGRDPGSAHASGATILCTEFGGVNIAPKEKGADEWGYTTAVDPEDLLKRIEKLVNAVVDGGLCAGFVWTQLCDIEQETNGLYSFERKEKLNVEKVKLVMEAAQKKYYDGLKAKKGEPGLLHEC